MTKLRHEPMQFGGLLPSYLAFWEAGDKPSPVSAAHRRRARCIRATVWVEARAVVALFDFLRRGVAALALLVIMMPTSACDPPAPWHMRGQDGRVQCHEAYFDLNATEAPSRAICPHPKHRLDVVYPPKVSVESHEDRDQLAVVVCRCPRVEP